jgi:putative glutamine amidotransferase
MKIGVTRNTKSDEKFKKYLDWLSRLDPFLQFSVLSYKQNNEKDIETCDGLFLTGGGDVHPKFYGREDALAMTEDADEKRDEFEFNVIRRAFSKELPALAVCRGLQSMNVFLGGSLILDVEREGYQKHSGETANEKRHSISLEPQTMIADVVGKISGEVNSYHHQAADTPGKDLIVSSRSPDGVTESMEWEVKDGKPFLLMVQWHPERIPDIENPFSKKIGEAFLTAVQKKSTTQNVTTTTYNQRKK